MGNDDMVDGRTGPPGRPASDDRISVALSTYNTAAFVGAQLESVLTQSPMPTQIVVGDDKSSDGTPDVVEEVRQQWVRRGIDVEWTILDGSRHFGLRGNMNRILEACRHEVIVICDSDDVCLPGRFERIMEWFDRHPGHLMVTSDAVVIDADGSVVAPSMMSQRQLSPAEWDLLRSDRAFELLVRRFVAEGAVSAYRRELLDSVLPIPDSLVYDGWLAIMASAMERFGFDERPSIQYRVHGANVSGGVRRRSLLDKVRMLLEPGAERNERWLARTQDVLAGIESVRDDVPDWAYELAASSAEHQRIRSGYPSNRLVRAPHVLRHATSGAYQRCGRGAKDVVLDLVQPTR